LHEVYFYTFCYNAAVPLSIKNEATERLARQVADETGESITEAIQRSLEERWERLKTRRRGRVLTRQIEDLLRRVDALPTLDPRSPDEILGYDDHGMPR
jgi:antitoxin VapB